LFFQAFGAFVGHLGGGKLELFSPIVEMRYLQNFNFVVLWFFFTWNRLTEKNKSVFAMLCNEIGFSIIGKLLRVEL